MKASMFYIFGLFLLSSSPCWSGIKETGNYCRDEESWRQWHDLLDKHSQDDTIHALYATRRGLCFMVELGQVDLDRATRIFEKMRESLIVRYRELENEEQEVGKKMM